MDFPISVVIMHFVSFVGMKYMTKKIKAQMCMTQSERHIEVIVMFYYYYAQMGRAGGYGRNVEIRVAFVELPNYFNILFCTELLCPVVAILHCTHAYIFII